MEAAAGRSDGWSGGGDGTDGGTFSHSVPTPLISLASEGPPSLAAELELRIRKSGTLALLNEAPTGRLFCGAASCSSTTLPPPPPLSARSPSPPPSGI